MISKSITLGILAHVDSGKTTLAEAILYKSGIIKNIGRVDHRDTFLDTYALEKKRGITIFSKQANICIDELKISILDTPGHVDFSAEMERTLQILDYAILVISGADGIQGHTLTLWRLLERYNIPTFIFINKMDQVGTNKEQLMKKIEKMLDENCINFNCEKENDKLFYENISLCDEELMDIYISNESISSKIISKKINERKIYPCYFGSALKVDGIDDLLNGIKKYAIRKEYNDIFSGRVYKIGRDEKNNRLTYIKITGGKLRVKDLIEYELKEKSQIKKESEKIDQIRIYSGNQYNTCTEVEAGTVCAVTGLSKTYIGQGIGSECEPEIPILMPVLNYKINVPQEINVHDFFIKLKQLEEEQPEINLVWDEKLNEIFAQVMGEVHIEILKNIIHDRFNVEVEFGTGNIVYKESIEEPVVGIGHFEPLKHYAEVHLLMEPLERGSGLEFETKCSEDILDKNWQRLILTHLEEKKHIGVLTGSEITDIKISIINGRAHLKHTEGGDFRQATYRALRQGLKSAKSILLEPIYEFRIELPKENVGRAMSDIQQRHGSVEPPQINNDIAVLTGSVPVSTIRDYQNELISYTKGYGRISYILKGYEKCHNEEEIIQENSYDSENDLENPTGSIFCSHGAGYYVRWDLVPKYAHIKNEMTEEVKTDENDSAKKNVIKSNYNEGFISQDEIEEIYNKTFGGIKQKRIGWNKKVIESNDINYKGTECNTNCITDKEYLLVDGYNIIFAWPDLHELADKNIDSARDKLMDILCNYQGYKKMELILVFDAYKVAGGTRTITDYHNIHIVYTKEAETADQYIEKFTKEVGKKYKVTVATSDRLEQMIILGDGANRLSAMGLLEEIRNTSVEINESIIDKSTPGDRKFLFDNVSEEVKKNLEKIKNSN